MDALQGKINGVQVTSGGGPGAQPKVLIRGVTDVGKMWGKYLYLQQSKIQPESL